MKFAGLSGVCLRTKSIDLYTLATMVFEPRNRVLQLDGALLDVQTETILEDQLRDALSDGSLPIKVQRFGSRYNEEFKLVLKLIMYKLFVWDTSTTYGLLMQNLKFSNFSVKREGNHGRIKTLAGWSKVALLLQLLSSYIAKKIESMVYDDDQMEALNSANPTLHQLLTSASLRKLANMLQKLLKVTEFVNGLLFLTTGNYTTLLHRLCGIRHERIDDLDVSFASNPQSISYEFQDRQLIWNGITEFLEHVQLPSISSSVMRTWRKRWLRNRDREDGSDEEGEDMGEFKFLPERCCAFCYRGDGHGIVDSSLVTNCYVLPCGHGYCYMCIVREMENVAKEEKKGIKCLRCGDVATFAEVMCSSDSF